MAKILVTGNAGFIGMHLVLDLINEGHHVTGVDSINSYYDISLKHDRLAEQGVNVSNIIINEMVEINEQFKFLHAHLENRGRIDQLFEEESFDYVIHLAAQAGVRYSLENPHEYVRSNIDGTLNILEGCRKQKVKHLVFASSSSVYGLNEQIPFKESHPTEHPVSLYASTKKANEMMAHNYSYIYNLPVTGLRFFTVYGPWGRPDMALFKFTKAIKNGDPIDIYNEGNLSRDFTYVQDIVDGIKGIFKVIPTISQKTESILKTDESPAPYAIYNIGNGSPVKLLDFIVTLEEKIGIEAKKNFLPMQPGDVYKTFANTTKLVNKIGYSPKMTLDEGIEAFVNWYESYYN